MGNAKDISNLGTSDILYIWLKGQKVDLIDDVIDVFLNSENAKIIVTSEKIESQDVEFEGNFQCKFSGSSNSMNMNIYSKKYINKKKKQKDLGYTQLDEEIEKAYKTHITIHNEKRAQKEEYIKKVIRSLELQFPNEITDKRERKSKQMNNKQLTNKKETKYIKIDLTLDSDHSVIDLTNE